MAIRTLTWVGDGLELLDQTLLPVKEEHTVCRDVETVADAIERLVVRGAPAIGVSAAYGVVIGAMRAEPTARRDAVSRAIERLRRTRPTAVNLFWALDRMRRVASETADSDLIEGLLAEAQTIDQDDTARCRHVEAGSHTEAGPGTIPHDSGGPLTVVGFVETAHGRQICGAQAPCLQPRMGPAGGGGLQDQAVLGHAGRVPDAMVEVLDPEEEGASVARFVHQAMRALQNTQRQTALAVLWHGADAGDSCRAQDGLADAHAAIDDPQTRDRPGPLDDLDLPLGVLTPHDGFGVAHDAGPPTARVATTAGPWCMRGRPSPRQVCAMR